ncbi:MAG: fibronectin type III domain-containing protein [Gemmatimonadales bacterium]
MSLALFLAGCGDPPLSPDEERASLSAQGSPTAPSNLTAEAVSLSEIYLAWRDESSSETGFEVQRSTTGPRGTFAPVTQTSANITTYTNPGLSPLTQYCYKVRAVWGTSNKPKYSAFSNTGCATPPSPPAPPSDLRAVAMSPTQIDLSWIDHATDETGFSIERCQGADCGEFVELAQVTADAVTFVNRDLLANTTYRYRIRAHKRIVFSEYTPIATATTMPPPPLTLVASTTGVEFDADGYTIHVWEGTGAGRTVNLPANGKVTFTDLRLGEITLTLSGEATNCYLTSPGSQVIDYKASTTVTFDLICARSTTIAYATTAAGNVEIYTINSTGLGAPTRLTFHPALDAEPAWSPDGARIAFRSERDGNSEIYVMNADGSNPVRLTSDVAHDESPTWSPDGSRIAFVRTSDSGSEILLMNADGTEVRTTNQVGSGPAWLPDGNRIAFASGPIYLVNPDGTGITRLTNPFNDGVQGHMVEYDTGPAWSPDGNSIVFARTNCDGFGFGCITQLMIVNPNSPGSETTLIWTNNYVGTSEGEPVWSPEGQKVAYVDVESILVIRRDGTAGSSVTAGFNPAWRR